MATLAIARKSKESNYEYAAYVSCRAHSTGTPISRSMKEIARGAIISSVKIRAEPCMSGEAEITSFIWRCSMAGV